MVDLQQDTGAVFFYGFRKMREGFDFTIVSDGEHAYGLVDGF